MKKLQLIVILLSMLVFSFSCKKEKGNDPLPPISTTPEITNVSVNSSSIKEFDDLIFSISYTDGDGDLGTADADTKSIFITDNRGSGITHEFHLQPLAPENTSIAIQGVLNVSLDNVILLNANNTTETATFTIQLRDKSNKTSNAVTTGSILINK